MRRFMIALACLMGPSFAAQAADGELDPTFHNGAGVVFPSFSYVNPNVADHRARGLAIDAEQRIVVVGDFLQNGVGADRDCGILRLLPDATGYDTGFLAPLGYGYFNFNRGGSNTDECHAVAALADGSSIVVGSATVDANDRRVGLVMRLGSDGLPDPAFFGDGVFDSDNDGPGLLVGHDLSFRQVLIDAEGRAVVSGNVVADNAGSLTGVGVVLRFAADGTLDNTFGAFLGLAVAETSMSITASAMDANGAYWLAGNRSGSADGDGGHLFRVLADGSLDPALYGLTGYYLPGCAHVESVAIDNIGRVLVGCFPPAASGLVPGLLRLHFFDDEWQIDPAFGSNGFAEIRLAADDAAGGGDNLQRGISQLSALRVLADGRILVAGSYSYGRVFLGDPADVIAVRLNDDGSTDSSFAGDGSATYGFSTPIDRDYETASAMALDAEGRPLLVGRSASGAASKYVVARLQQLPDDLFRDSFEQ